MLGKEIKEVKNTVDRCIQVNSNEINDEIFQLNKERIVLDHHVSLEHSFIQLKEMYDVLFLSNKHLLEDHKKLMKKVEEKESKIEFRDLERSNGSSRSGIKDKSPKQVLGSKQKKISIRQSNSTINSNARATSQTTEKPYSQEPLKPKNNKLKKAALAATISTKVKKSTQSTKKTIQLPRHNETNGNRVK